MSHGRTKHMKKANHKFSVVHIHKFMLNHANFKIFYLVVCRL